MLASALLLAAVWLSILRYIPDEVTYGLPWFPPNRSDPLNGFGLPAAIVLAFLLVFGLLGGWILAGHMLAPLARIRDATRMATTGSLAHRIRLPGRSDEFRELSDAFDAMLARLEAHVAEQQRFAANASHELRTPLAISQTLLDVAREDPTRDRGELIERLHEVNTRAIDRHRGPPAAEPQRSPELRPEPVDLSLLAEEATETLLPLAEQRGITLDVTGESTQTAGPRRSCCGWWRTSSRTPSSTTCPCAAP
jgi:two-component system sensor histidine kinase VanS